MFNSFDGVNYLGKVEGKIDLVIFHQQSLISDWLTMIIQQLKVATSQLGCKLLLNNKQLC